MPADVIQTVTDPAAVERRVWRNLIVVAAIAPVAGFALADARFALGLALGAALAVLNYRWLHASLKGILAAGTAKTPPGTTIKFILRWFVVAAVAYAAYSTGYFDGAGILAGLTVPAAAVIVEAGYVTFRSLARKQ